MSLDLTTFHQPLTDFLQTFLDQEKSRLNNDELVADIFARITDFTVKGKLIRGSLSLIAYQLFTGSDPQPMLPLAAAMECMQSALLIHDDFMDHDRFRRGHLSMMAQYQDLAEVEGYQSPEHTGASLAICVGDICFFLGMQLLGQLKVAPEVLAQLQTEFAREYILVGLGQIQDITLTASPDPVTKDKILSMYRYKTARYTFALPLILAGIVAKADPTLRQHLLEIAETLGLIFQIKDDELGLFGQPSQTGKAISSDIREGKKTLYYLYGLAKMSENQRHTFLAAFGNPQVTDESLAEVRQLLQTCGAVEEVKTYLNHLTDQARQAITKLGDEKWQAFLSYLLDFNVARQK